MLRRVVDVTAPDGTRLHCAIYGQGPPLVVCAGGPSTTFEYLVDDLMPLATERTLVFHDYRGSGQSSVAPPESYTFDRLGDDVAVLASELSYESVDVLAHSMGVCVALSLAVRHPALVHRLVLIDGSPSGVAARMALPTLRALGMRRTLMMLGRALTYLTVWHRRPESEERTLARFSIMGTMQEGAPRHRAEVRKREVLSHNDNAARLERSAATFDVVDQLAQIAVPVLVVYGSRDAPFVAGARLLIDRLPNAQELCVMDSGHHPLVEAPQIVLDEIRTFLSRT